MIPYADSLQILSHSVKELLYIFSQLLLYQKQKLGIFFCFARIAVPTPLSPPPKTTILFIYLNFNVAIVNTANKIPTIQKRVTILLS